MGLPIGGSTDKDLVLEWLTVPPYPRRCRYRGVPPPAAVATEEPPPAAVAI